MNTQYVVITEVICSHLLNFVVLFVSLKKIKIFALNTLHIELSYLNQQMFALFIL